MNDTPTRCKKTFVYHYKPESNELTVYNNATDFVERAGDFKPGDGTRVFKGTELEFKVKEQVVLA